MIEQISIENFMRLDDCRDIPLGRLTVLVGGNGSGKSSVLKAIHWASRCASLVQGEKLDLEGMDYLPSQKFRSLAHRSKLQSRNRKGSKIRPIKVLFDAQNDIGSIVLRSTENDAGVSVAKDGNLPFEFDSEDPQTAYIPGLAGLAEEETILANPIFRRRAASGDAGAVLRQMLLFIASEEFNTGPDEVELKELSSHVGKLFPGVQFWVKFDQRRDSKIEVNFLLPDMKIKKGSNNTQMRRPLEMAGTGLLQVTQIFAYLLAFKPRLLLLDEPDAHLHQTSQEKLMKALEAALKDFQDTQVIISTHSPRLVQALGPSSKVVWLENGAVKTEGKNVKTQMGWGALDKDIVLFSEDDNTDMLHSIIDQWSHLTHRVVIWPCFGVSSLPQGDNLAKLRDRYGIKILVHRDRDFMSDEDVKNWKKHKGYEANNIPLWVTPGSDIESCFQRSDHIANVLGVTQQLVEQSIAQALATFEEKEAQAAFSEAYNKALQNTKGQNNPIGRWNELGGLCQATVKGKRFQNPLNNEIKSVLKNNGLQRNRQNAPEIYSCHNDVELCADLKAMIEALVQALQAERSTT